jgi:subtilisin-like proprotein convertase family protein
MGCFDGGIPAWNSALSQWICAVDQDTDADTLAGLNCANGGVPVWDALLTQWTCALSSDTVLTEGEVEAYVINGAIDLNAATTMGGQSLATTDQLTGIDFSTLSGVPSDLADGDDILTENQVETFITNAPIDLPAGTTINGEVIGAGANLGSNVTIGSVVPGDNYLTDHTLSPVPIPDDNVFGFNSPRFVAGGATSINNFSVDVNITHPEMGDLRITLYAPDDTAVLMYDGEQAGTSNMVGNIARDFAISGGTIYALYGKDANGTWRLEVIDTASGNAGTLNSWALNINETWSGDLFVGNSITSDGDITTTGNIEVIQGSDLVFKNTAGTETLRINGETGLITGASSGCPSDMAQQSDYCIERNERSSDQWYDAANTCASIGRRLCSSAEWVGACRQNNGALQNMTGNWEWTDDYSYNDNAQLFGHNSCTHRTWSGDGSNEYFRCCVNPS